MRAWTKRVGQLFAYTKAHGRMDSNACGDINRNLFALIVFGTIRNVGLYICLRVCVCVCVHI